MVSNRHIHSPSSMTKDRMYGAVMWPLARISAATYEIDAIHRELPSFLLLIELMLLASRTLFVNTDNGLRLGKSFSA